MSDIYYICDRKKCPKCSPNCKHTSDISHAANFKHVLNGDYIEKRNQTYIFRLKYNVRPCDSEKIRKGIIKQLETGAILLPPGVEVVKDAGWATIRTAKERIKGGEKNE